MTPTIGTRAGWWCLCLTAAAFLALPAVGAQAPPRVGDNIAPAFEGWYKNADGSFNLSFGYYNRNWDEEIDVPIGPDNSFQPGPADRGQPTHFLPRRSRFVFDVRVPADFGKGEMIWTITSHGKTERVYGTLIPAYFIDDIVVQSNNGAGGGEGGGAGFNPDMFGNKAPVLKVEGENTRHIRVGQPLTLVAVASDDGQPRRRSLPVNRGGNPTQRLIPGAATGLRLSWYIYRGAGQVSFDPPQTAVWEDTRVGANSPWSAGWIAPPVPPDGKWLTRATFSERGTYVVRALAHDGGLSTVAEITVIVDQ